MSKYFNEYGNPEIDGELSNLRDKIESIIRKFVKKMIEDGASYLELRSVAQYLSSAADFEVCISMLQKQLRQQKEERNEI